MTTPIYKMEDKLEKYVLEAASRFGFSLKEKQLVYKNSNINPLRYYTEQQGSIVCQSFGVPHDGPESKVFTDGHSR